MRYHDLDVNRHVNNVRVVEWALETLPPEIHDIFWCTAFSLQFMAETRLHDSTGANVSVVLVSRERKKKVRQFLEKKDYSMPVYVTSDLPSVFDGNGIPRTYVIGADGRVLYRHVGTADWNADAVHRFLGRLNGNRPSGASS